MRDQPFRDLLTINAVIRSTAEFPSDIGTFRRYVSRVMVRQGTPFDRRPGNRKILYHVGARSLIAREAIPVYDPNSYLPPQVFELNQELCTQLAGMVGKDANIRSTCQYCDLAYVMQTLGRAVGYYANTGMLTCDAIRNGKEMAIRSFPTSTLSVSCHNRVFIPSQTDPDVFSVLAAAVNNAGVAVVTDYINVDGNNTPVVNEPQNMEAFHAVWIAVRALMHQAKVSNAGGSMAIAFVSGLHDTMTVVAHTEEGGLFRDILRRVRYGAPFGAILAGLWREYKHVAGLSINPTMTEVQTMVDGLALVTAACAALGDPLAEVDGRKYPTISVAKHTGQTEAAKARSMANGHLAYLRGSGHLLAEGVATAMATALGCPRPDSRATEAIMVGMTNLSPDCRHLQHPVIAPAYWIEPTSLFDVPMGTAADKAGYGLMAGRKSWTTYDTYKLVQEVGNNDLAEYMHIEWRTARTVGVVLGGLGDVDNILNDVSIRQLNANQLTCFRGKANLMQRLAAAERLPEYLWRHRACWLPAPAEMLNTSGVLGIKVHKRIVDEEGNTKKETAFPTLEWRSRHGAASVSLMATRPCAITMGGAGDLPREINRMINQAAVACQSGRVAHRAGQFSVPLDWRFQMLKMPISAGIISAKDPPASDRDAHSGGAA